MSVGTGIKVLPPRYDLAHALLTVGLLIDAIYSFVMRLGARDIDTSVYDFIVNRSGFCSYVFARAPVDKVWSGLVIWVSRRRAPMFTQVNPRDTR